MSKKGEPGRWTHRALTLALLVLGVAVMALLYALVSQNFSLEPPAPAPRPELSAEEAAPVSNAASDSAREIIQVGVRNGCGQPGLAAEMRSYLVQRDFDVVEVGNHSSFDLDSSLVIDRVGDLAAARRVAAALGIPRRRVRQDLRPEYYLDASVLIGSDYRTLEPFRDDASAR